MAERNRPAPLVLPASRMSSLPQPAPRSERGVDAPVRGMPVEPSALVPDRLGTTEDQLPGPPRADLHVILQNPKKTREDMLYQVALVDLGLVDPRTTDLAVDEQITLGWPSNEPA
jgi:hypothetical protein